MKQVVETIAVRWVLVASTAVILTVVGAITGAAFSSPQGVVVSDDPVDYTPNVQNGYVSSIAEVGDRVIVAGTFTSVKEVGDPTAYTRNYVFAYDKNTGELDDTFLPDVDGIVNVVKPASDGTSVFLGGKFANVNGSPNFGLAKIDVATGQQVAGFSATTAGAVRDLAVGGGKVYLGGDIWSVNGIQKSRLAAIDEVTGAVDPTFDVGTTLARTSVDWVAKLDVNPAATELVIVGNFLEVDNLFREQIAKIDLTGPQAAVMDWSTDQFTPNCSNNFWTYMRDVEYSPDGSYFVTATTGGPFLNTLCDTASRWETGVTGSDLFETWADWSGGDTLTAVAVTDVAVYIGGHQRWMNNHTGRDFAGIGAVSRPGISALDPINGVPFAWNPGKSRGVAVYDLVATPDMLYVGSDTDFTAGEYHAKIASFPVAGGTVVPQPTPASLPSDLYAGRTNDAFALRSYDGTTFGSEIVVSDPIDWSTVGGAFHQAGKVYYIDGDELTSRTYDGSNWGAAVAEPSWTTWVDNESLGWHEGRVYYTVNGDTDLHYRYLSLESGIVGSQTFTASGGIDWSSVEGIAFVDDDLYYASTDGNLRRVPMVDGIPAGGSETVVSGPGSDGLDWSNVNGLFFLSFDFGPTVALTDPANGATIDGTITVSATASDDDGVDQVEFFADTVSLGIDSNGTNGWSVSWDTAASPDGAVVVTATATDTGGNDASDSVTVTVDNDGPNVVITSPSAGSTVSGSVAITADATDAVGVAQVEFFADGASVGVDDNGSDGWSATWASTTSADGPVTLSATATDLNAATATDQINVTVDNSAAGVVLYIVGNPASLNSGTVAVIDRLEADGFTVVVMDDDVVTTADAAGTSFVIIGSSTNSSTVGTKFVSVAQPVWNAKPWNFDDMGYTLTVSGTDFGTTSTSTVTIVDEAHPLAAGLSGTIGFTSSNRSASWGQPGTAADIIATANGLPVIFAYDAGDQLADGSTAAGCRLSFSLFQSAPAVFTGDAWTLFDAATDLVSTGCVVVPPNPPPTVTVTAPADASIVVGMVPVTATATDPDGVDQVEFFVDGVSIGVDTDDSDGWSLTWDSTATGDGAAVVVEARATDGLGAVGSDAVTVSVDNEGPTVTITAPGDGSTVGGTVNVTADAVDTVGVSHVEFFVDGVSVDVDTDGSDGWSALWDTTASSGTVSLSATATDTNGAVDSDAISVTVDNTSSGVVLFVVGNPASLNVGDTAVKTQLESSGYVVTLADDNAVTGTDAAGVDLVIIGSSVNSNVVGSTFNGVSVPVWDAKPWHFDDLGLTGGSPNTDFGSMSTSTVDIVDAAHPMAAGYSGTVPFTSSNRSVSWGVPAADADIVFEANGMVSAFVYETGDLLADGTVAAGCRLTFPLFTSGPTLFTADAWALFDAAASFATGGCTAPPPPAANPTAVVVSVDGLRVDTVLAMGATELPNFHRLINEGASTANARTVVESTNTLPNHLSIVTGRPVTATDGHGVTFNEDDGLTVHDTAGQYIASMFDVAHDNGLDTLLFASKPKFDFLDRSWDAANGAVDVTGADNGTDKIDHYMRSDGSTITASFLTQMTADNVELSLIHFGIPDGTAHDFGFESPEYEQALRDVDAWIGSILDYIDNDPALSTDAVVIVTTDHGGTGFEHGDETAAINYTIPLYVWGSGVAAGSDIYTLTGGTRSDPGTVQPAYAEPVPPVRNADVANLALELIGLGPVPGSVINGAQDLHVVP